MTLANLFLLGWNYEKWKYILPFNRLANDGANLESSEISAQTESNADERRDFSRFGIDALYRRFRIFLKQLLRDKFPLKFFAGVFAAVVFFVVVVPDVLYRIKPRNTLAQCLRQFNNRSKTVAGENFCDCIHRNGEPLDKCLTAYENAPDDDAR